jgi:hypothetical protein
MAYNKAYYEANREKMLASTRKWYMKRRDAMIEAGMIRSRLTEEEKAERAKEAVRKTMERYHSDPIFRENCLKKFRDRYHSDPDFREKKAEYLRNWRAKRKLSQNTEKE